MTMLSRRAALWLAAGAAALPRRVGAQSSMTIRVGASATATQAEAYYADKLGFFRTAGITTTQTLVTRSSDALSAIVRGDLDVGATTVQAIANAIIRGLPIRVIATSALYAGDPPPIGLFVSKNSSVSDDPKAFESATIAVQTLSDAQTVGILAWMRQHDVATNKVKFVEIPFPTMAAALSRGEVAAACIVEPFASSHKDDIRRIARVYDSLGTRWAMLAWYGRRDWVAKDPSLVKQFATALYATAHAVTANPQSVDDLLSSYSKIPLDVVRATPRPIFAEVLEPAQYTVQMQASADFKATAKLVTFNELTGR